MTEKSIKKISDLIFDDKNPNEGTERGREFIEESLRTYGAGRSLLCDKNNKVMAGNKTGEIAGSIGIDKVRVIETDGTEIIVVKRIDVDFDTPRGREMALADNRCAQVDIDFNPGILAALEDLGANVGKFFTGGELEVMAQNFGKDDDGGGKKTPTEGDPIKCPSCQHEFVPPKGEKKTRMGLRERIARAHPQQGQQ